MARQKRRRARPFNLRKVRINVSTSIGAVAAADLITGPLTAVSTNPYRVMSAELAYSVTDLAAFIDDGQTVGLNHGDYTNAEVEECLEAQGAIDIANLVEQEQANRLVREIGVMAHGGSSTDSGAALNDGRPVKTKLNWRIGIGDTVSVWIRNGSDTVWTDGSNLLVTGHIWIKDGL